MDNYSRATSGGSRKGGHTHAGLDFTVNIVSGQDLAACDYNLLGKPTTSDPYVIVSILREAGEPMILGRTKHINANLNPQWNATISKSLPAGTFHSDHYTLRLTIMDKDMIGSDDCMGIVEIHMGLETLSKPNAWYDIVEGSAPNASGRIQVGIEAKLTYSMESFRPGKGSSSHGNNLEEKKDEVGLAPNLLGAGTAVLGAGTAAATTVLGAGLGVGAVATNVVTGGVTTTATGAAKGVTGMTGRLFRKGGKTQAKAEEEEEYENIYKEEEHLMLEITAHKGEGLVAKDRNVMGKKVTSDPFVVVELWPKGIPTDMDHEKDYPKERFGRSPTVMKTLNPEWDYAFDVHYVPLDSHFDTEEAQLRVRIVDDDFGISVDDPMGSIDIHLQAQKQLDIREKWYPVSAISCTRASGRVQLSISTTKVKQQVVIGTKKKKKAIQADPALEDHSKSVGNDDVEESGDEEALAALQAERRAKKEEARRASRRQRQERSRRNVAGSRRQGLSQSERLDDSRRRDVSTSARRVNSRDKDGSRRERRTLEPGDDGEGSRRRVAPTSARRVISRDKDGSRRERRTLEPGVDGEGSRRRVAPSARRINSRDKDGSRRERRTIEPGANGDSSQRMGRSARTSSRRDSDDKVPSSPKKHVGRPSTNEKKNSKSSRRMDGPSRRAEGSSRRMDDSSKRTGSSSKRIGEYKRRLEKAPVVGGPEASAMNSSSTSLGRRSTEGSRRRGDTDASSSRRRNGEASSSRRRSSEDDGRVKPSRATGEKKKSSRSGISSKDKHEARKTGSSHRRPKQASCDTSPRRIPQ